MSSGIRSSFRTASAAPHECPTLESLRSACAKHFLPPEYRVRRDDATSAVWVSLDGHRLEVGVQPCTVARQGIALTLEKMDSKLRRRVGPLCDDRR